MKTTLITTFAIALMVFVFDTTPAVAKGEDIKQGFKEMGQLIKCNFEGLDDIECEEAGRVGQLDDLDERDSGQSDNEREVADSDNEGPTSAAQESDQ